ncbi:transmembrane signal receptor [Lithospermum erythrorhizon]|uniref:Transmembrane signal receptor n=1 Tax=Lithospermum erythrorhizon TaxID=34254 RepID=A0AAV3RLQ7_LITER
MFILRSGSAMVVLLLYVDDILLTASTTSLLDRVIGILKDEFSMTELGSLNYFLGISTVCQVSTPMVTRTYLLVDEDDPDFVNPNLYRSIVGALQYLTFTRPDIQFAVNQVCQFMHHPRQSHYVVVKQMLCYIKGTISYGLHIKADPPSSLLVYSDADWAGCPSTRRSTTGVCIFLGSTLVFWSSKKQATVSRSSVEAEYRGVAQSVAELEWLQSVLTELGLVFKSCPVVLCDNISTTYMAANSVNHARTKHIEIDIHFVRERYSQGHLKVSYVPTADQLADFFTMSLSSNRFQLLCSNFGIGVPPASIEGG